MDIIVTGMRYCHNSRKVEYSALLNQDQLSTHTSTLSRGFQIMECSVEATADPLDKGGEDFLCRMPFTPKWAALLNPEMTQMKTSFVKAWRRVMRRCMGWKMTWKRSKEIKTCVSAPVEMRQPCRKGTTLHRNPPKGQ